MNATYKGYKFTSKNFKEGLYALLRDSVKTENRWSYVETMEEMVTLTKRGTRIEFIAELALTIVEPKPAKKTSFTTKQGVEIKLENVMSVYSGKVGRCACGCSGNHRYASKYRVEAGIHRGYAVSDDEINDAQVKKIFDLIANTNPDDIEGDTDCYFIDTHTRTYVIYLG